MPDNTIMGECGYNRIWGVRLVNIMRVRLACSTFRTYDVRLLRHRRMAESMRGALRHRAYLEKF